MYIYKIGPHCDLANLQLTSDDWVEIHTAVSKYGKLNTQQIVSFSKATAPMRKAQQYNTLELTQDTPLTPEEVAADPFWRETSEAMANKSERITLEALRARSG